MALVTIPERQQTIDDTEAVSRFLASYGITYERWESSRNVPADATAEAVLQVYSDKVEELKLTSEKGDVTTLKKENGTWNLIAPQRSKADESEASAIASRR